MTFDELPREAQHAVEAYCAEMTDDERRAHIRRFAYTLDRVSLDALCVDIVRAGLSEGATFMEYHAWYCNHNDVPNHGASVWPVILGEGVIDDGWHRFHSYVRRGLTYVPTLRMVPR
jgi:hypothetical protein